MGPGEDLAMRRHSHPRRRSQWPDSEIDIQENTAFSFLSLSLGSLAFGGL